MGDIVDVIHRLSYEVSDAGRDSVIRKMQVQADAIDKLKAKLADLNTLYDYADNPQAARNAQDAIANTTRLIDIQTQALQKQFTSNKQLQNAISDEIGLIQQLTQYIAQATKEQATLTDVSKIREYTASIKTARAELTALLSTPVTIRQTGAIEAARQRVKIIQGTIPTLPQEDIAAANRELEKAQMHLQELNDKGKTLVQTGGQQGGYW